jgi:hypothetical protein
MNSPMLGYSGARDGINLSGRGTSEAQNEFDKPSSDVVAQYGDGRNKHSRISQVTHVPADSRSSK